MTLIDDLKSKLKDARPVARALKFIGDVFNNLWKRWVDDNVPFSRGDKPRF